MKKQGSEPHYAIPLRYRKMENLHIVFWLFKDVAWCLEWKIVGLTMIAPTLLIAIIITWRTRSIVAEFCHNAAVTVWIMANSYWMISEFAGFDEHVVYGEYTYKHLAVIPFVIGLLFVGYYYIFYQWFHRRRSAVLTDSGLKEVEGETMVPLG